MDDERQAEGDGVDGRGTDEPVASQDAPTDQSFSHAAGTDLSGLLDIYARPDRRVLDRRSPTPGPSPFGPNDRRVGDRRAGDG